ncbi:MAG: TetR/AcrR family transcriptional regulator [bacterium]
MDEKTKIINYTLDHLFTKGYSSCTMDMISKGLHMSKKTLYKHFSSKDELIEAAIDSMILNIKTKIEAVVDNNKFNAIEKLAQIVVVVTGVFSKVNIDYFDYLRVTGYHIWEKIEEFRKKMIIENYSKVLEQGKREGYFVDKPNVIVITIMLTIIRAVVNPEFLINNNFSFETAARFSIDFIMNGLLTPKGRKLYEQLNKGL